MTPQEIMAEIEKLTRISFDYPAGEAILAAVGAIPAPAPSIITIEWPREEAARLIAEHADAARREVFDALCPLCVSRREGVLGPWCGRVQSKDYLRSSLSTCPGLKQEELKHEG